MFKKTGPLFLAAALILVLIVTGCGKSATNSGIATSNVRTPARTGNVTTGAKVEAASQSVAAAGGVISVSKLGDPLDGFVLNVPAGSFSGNSNFKISSAPITGQTFGSDINPISPLITIDNGGQESNQIVYIRIPAKVPDGYFAMGFIYDTSTRQLEGMPVVAADAGSVTIGTRHFCDMFLSMISKALLKSDIDSGFRPGVDDWQFTNRGSYIAPGGHCEGQSLSALWYYSTQPDGKNARLYGRYDNNGDKPATPSLWQDDSLGYRFASVVQKNVDSDSGANQFWLNMGGKDWQLVDNKWKLVDVPAGMSGEMTRDLFAYSMQVTNEPQLVVIWSSAGGGHAMIVYRVTEGNLYIADPNYPGNLDRRIIYANGKFQPYNSGANADEIAKGNGKAYENIQYYAKTTVMDWSDIDSYWTELKNKTIGDSKFPGYTLMYQNDKAAWVPLVDGTKTPFDAITIGAAPPTSAYNTNVFVFKDGTLLSYDAKGNYDLAPGNNRLGIEIIGKVGEAWKYIDFQYLNIVYEAQPTITTTKATPKGSHPVITSFTGPTDVSQLKDPAASVQFSIKISGGKPPYKETWYANMQQIFDGKNLETVTVPVSRLRFNGDSWTIYLMLEDSTGEQAAWIDSVGISHPEFVYGLTRGGQVVTEPSIPYRAFGAN
jgi:hypothetical protein